MSVRRAELTKPTDDRLNALSDEQLLCYGERNHFWQRHVHDYVHERNGSGQMIAMRREWDCTRCSRGRYCIIDTYRWIRGPYRYRGGRIIGSDGGPVDRDALLRALVVRTSNLFAA